MKNRFNKNVKHFAASDSKLNFIHVSLREGLLTVIYQIQQVQSSGVLEDVCSPLIEHLRAAQTADIRLFMCTEPEAVWHRRVCQN